MARFRLERAFGSQKYQGEAEKLENRPLKLTIYINNSAYFPGEASEHIQPACCAALLEQCTDKRAHALAATKMKWCQGYAGPARSHCTTVQRSRQPEFPTRSRCVQRRHHWNNRIHLGDLQDFKHARTRSHGNHPDAPALAAYVMCRHYAHA